MNTDGLTPLHGVPSCSSSQAFSLTQAPHLQLSIHSMALDSGSDTARPESNSTPRDTHGDSPEQPAQSDDPGPADSDGDSEVYEIEAILDAKRGATGSVSSCCHLLTKKNASHVVYPKTRIGYFVKWKGYPDEENSWVDERDAG